MCLSIRKRLLTVCGGIFALSFIFLLGATAASHRDLAGAYAELGFDPNAPGNAVIVYFSDPHMDLESSVLPAPVPTTNLHPLLIQVVNQMDPPPAKIVVAGDVSSSLAVIPGADGRNNPYVYNLATNEMAYFLAAVRQFTNINFTNIVWIPGNHDQGAYETNAETFRLMFPHMPPYQTFDVAGVRFFLINEGNYGELDEPQKQWLRAQVAATPKTQCVIVVAHQPPFTGIMAHRGGGVILKELFSDWESRWWVLDGHQHAIWIDVFDVGKSNVANFTTGPAGTNTFVGYTADCGFAFFCLTNGSVAGHIYYRYINQLFQVRNEPTWGWARRYVPAFDEIDGLLWRRLKKPGRSEEMVTVDATDSMAWWSYPKQLEWRIPLAQHDNQATHFLMLGAAFAPTTVFEMSADRADWRAFKWDNLTNSVFSFRLPDDVAGAEAVYVRLTAIEGDNWVGGWGLKTTNVPPWKTYPVLAPIADLVVDPGELLTVQTHALNPYAPPDINRFHLLAGPAGSSVDSDNGAFHWRPAYSDANQRFQVRLEVSDDAYPKFASSQEFSIQVGNATGPKLIRPALSPEGNTFQAMAHGGSFSVHFQDTNGSSGLLLTTNAPDFEFQVVDEESATQRFYQVIQMPQATDFTRPPLPASGQGPYRFTVTAPTGRFAVRVSEDLVEWRTLKEVLLPPFSFEVLDPNASEISPRVYTVVTQVGPEEYTSQ